MLHRLHQQQNDQPRQNALQRQNDQPQQNALPQQNDQHNQQQLLKNQQLHVSYPFLLFLFLNLSLNAIK